MRAVNSRPSDDDWIEAPLRVGQVTSIMDAVGISFIIMGIGFIINILEY